MRALVFADRDGAALAPLNARYAVALLPVVGKPLIVYRIEELVAAGILELIIVVSEHADQIEQALGGGQRWGARFRYVLSRGAERPSTIWSRISVDPSQPILVTRADLLRSPAVVAFLGDAQGISGSLVFGAAADPRASLVLLRPGCDDPGKALDTLDWQAPAEPPRDSVTSLPEGDLNLIEDLPGYHRANLDLVAGRLRGLAPAGRTVALGLTAGRRAQVSPKSLKQGQAYVGENSRVDPGAELLSDVVIANDVVVDREATIYDSVILPHTYVGELVEVGNAIVASNVLIRVDTGAVLNIADAFMLGQIGGSTGANGPRWIDRVGGLLLLVLSIPLWPLAAASAALSRSNGNSGALLRAGMLIGNRRSARPGLPGEEQLFSTWAFSTDIPVLARLPRILAVITGDLRLVGVSPLTLSESDGRTEAWQRVRDQAPVGLLGPTQIALPAHAPLDERLMSDAFYAGQRGDLKDLGWLWRGLLALFSAAAWRRYQAQPDGDRQTDW